MGTAICVRGHGEEFIDATQHVAVALVVLHSYTIFSPGTRKFP